MAPLSRLGRQIQEVLGGLERVGASGALIGGLALSSHKVIRATQDVDLLVDEAHADALDKELQALGYRCVHRSGDAGNYLRGDERVDLLYARRPVARRLLEAAQPHVTPFGETRVVSVEGLVAFKLQGLVNDPRRTQDLEDIRALLRANMDELDMIELRGYFRLLSERHSWMRSSQGSNETGGTSLTSVPLAAEGGVRYVVEPAVDWFTALDDLMAVVEAFCPTWPDRESFGPMQDLRL